MSEATPPFLLPWASHLSVRPCADPRLFSFPCRLAARKVNTEWSTPSPECSRARWRSPATSWLAISRPPLRDALTFTRGRMPRVRERHAARHPRQFVAATRVNLASRKDRVRPSGCLALTRRRPYQPAPSGRAGGPKSRGSAGQPESVKRVRRAARQPEPRPRARARSRRVVRWDVPLLRQPDPHFFPCPTSDSPGGPGRGIARPVSDGRRQAGALRPAGAARLARSSPPHSSCGPALPDHFVSRHPMGAATERNGPATMPASRSCGSGGIPDAAVDVAAGL